MSDSCVAILREVPPYMTYSLLAYAMTVELFDPKLGLFFSFLFPFVTKKLLLFLFPLSILDQARPNRAATWDGNGSAHMHHLMKALQHFLEVACQPPFPSLKTMLLTNLNDLGLGQECNE
jgi:hypothetical protein